MQDGQLLYLQLTNERMCAILQTGTQISNAYEINAYLLVIILSFYIDFVTVTSY